MELEHHRAAIEARGYRVAAISYDSPAILRDFAARSKISFPLLADEGSAVIRQFGLLNPEHPPGDFAHGVPFPGTYVANANGVIRERFFAATYQERMTAASFLVRAGDPPERVIAERRTPGAIIRVGTSNQVVFPGQRFTLVYEVALLDGRRLCGSSGASTPRCLAPDARLSAVLANEGAAGVVASVGEVGPLSAPSVDKGKEGVVRFFQDVTLKDRRGLADAFRAKEPEITIQGDVDVQTCATPACAPDPLITFGVRARISLAAPDSQRAPEGVRHGAARPRPSPSPLAASTPTPTSAPRSVAPPLEDFVALTSRDEKIHHATAARLAPVWRNGYAAMLIDLARFFRPARAAIEGGADAATLSTGPSAEGLGEEGAQTGSAPPSGRGLPSFSAARTPESLIRQRLMRFLQQQTKQGFSDDLKAWRRWVWSLPYDPHPEYAAFKSRLYANVDPRMATFFESREPSRIRLDEIDWGGVGVNGIPPLEQPKVVPAQDARFMGEKNVVFGVVVNGEARAYPKRILAWHEMALDTLGGVKLAIVYCTLCGTVIPYESDVAGRSFRFGTSGLLYRSNKLMFDWETKSLWSTLEGRPVVGPLASSNLELRYRPVVTTTWKEWVKAHPKTTVLSLDTGHTRDYDEGVAYRAYFAHDDLMFEVPEQDKRLKRKAEVLTFFAGDSARTPVALDVAMLRKNPVYPFSAGGLTYVALTTEGGANRIYRTEGSVFTRLAETSVLDDQGRSWSITEDAIEGPGGSRPREPARRTFWFAWFAQFENTLLFK